MRKGTWLLALAALFGSAVAANAGTDMVSGHDYDLPSRAWQPPPPPEESAVGVPPPPVYYAPPPPYVYGYYGPGFYGPAIGIRFHGRF